MKKQIFFVLGFSLILCFMFSNVVYAKGIEFGIQPYFAKYYLFEITNNGAPPIESISVTITAGPNLESIDYYDEWEETVDGNSVTYEAESFKDMIFAGKGLKWWDGFAFHMDAEGSFSVTVVDTINPEWITAARNRTYNYGSSIEFQVGAWDPAGIENWTMSDNENFLLIEESYGETSLATIINTHILNVGEYQISLEAIDTNGNTASMVFTITIIATNAGQGTSSDLAFILSLAGIGVAAFALVIGLIAFMTSRRQIKSSK